MARVILTTVTRLSETVLRFLKLCVQLTGQISENLGEDERLVQGLCALLLGICIYYNDNSLENYTKYVLNLCVSTHAFFCSYFLVL